jgi:hypothetical protein
LVQMYIRVDILLLNIDKEEEVVQEADA